jgi:hypothetical protein
MSRIFRHDHDEDGRFSKRQSDLFTMIASLVVKATNMMLPVGLLSFQFIGQSMTNVAELQHSHTSAQSTFDGITGPVIHYHLLQIEHPRHQTPIFYASSFFVSIASEGL